MKVGLKPQTLNFIEENGIKFFERFTALDKNKVPIKIAFDNYDEFTRITAKDSKDEELGFYSLLFKKDERAIEGNQIIAHEQGRNIGQILTLSSLIELSKNQLNKFKLFSLRDAIPFHTRLGFIIDSDDPYYICDGLKQVAKTKLPNTDEFKYNAKFFLPKVKDGNNYIKEDKFIFYRGCKVISDFMKFVSQNGFKKGMPKLDNGCYMYFSDNEILTNRRFLNPLLKQHNIDYEL